MYRRRARQGGAGRRAGRRVSRPSESEAVDPWRGARGWQVSRDPEVGEDLLLCAGSVREPGVTPVHSGTLTTATTPRPLSLEWTAALVSGSADDS